MSYLKKFFVLPCFVIIGCVLIASCRNNTYRNKSHKEISTSSIESGRELAIKYCQSCHALPDPGLLNSVAWEKGVLPMMGPRLGIFHFNGIEYHAARFDMSLGTNFYPTKPTVTQQEWQDLMNYYTATSPDSLSNAKNGQKQVKDELSLFSVNAPVGNYYNSATSMVKIWQEGTSNNLIISDALKRTMYRYDTSLKILDSVKTRGPIVDLELQAGKWLACDIGVLNPNNGKYGQASNFTISAKSGIQLDTSKIFDGLQRPVQILPADLNKDGKTDYVVCEFGYLTGALSWMENKGNAIYDRHVLRPLPGAIKAYINDYNHDGLPDLWVLFAQGEEGVFLFTNKGNGQFEQRQVLRFPPVYGSSYFEFDDFNKDGYPDILYTCGDNADYSTILKPYHGVYIFLNDGKNNFSQKFFFHINGCYKAIARDFDNDGDLDLATISFFADYKNKPDESFVYLENNSNYNFQPYSLPETQKGRWLTMDAGDFDGDGKVDLILGNFSIGPALLKSKYNWKLAPPFLLLKNTGKRPS